MLRSQRPCCDQNHCSTFVQKCVHKPIAPAVNIKSFLPQRYNIEDMDDVMQSGLHVWVREIIQRLFQYRKVLPSTAEATSE